MAQQESTVSSDQQPSLRHRLFDALTIPWVDKTIAVLAVLPFIYHLPGVVTRAEMSLPRTMVAINALILIVTMLFRTPPVRVTLNPRGSPWFSRRSLISSRCCPWL